MIKIPVPALETPALLVDMEAIEHNIATMADFLADKQCKLRPHFKTVKVPDLSLMQLAAGAKGITCAKLSEAEVLAEAGVPNVLIANQVIWPSKIERLAKLAGKTRMCVAVDSEANARDLSQACVNAGTTLYCLVEYDCGAHRCGVRSIEDGVALAKLIEALPNLVFEGIQAYEAHIVLKPEEEVRREGAKESNAAVAEFRDALLAAGLCVNEISGGGTGTYKYTGGGDVYTELQAGSYLYMDGRYGKLGLPFKNAQFVLGTIMSKHPGIAFADVGLKSFGMDNGNPILVGHEDLFIKLNEEHCRIDDPEDIFKVGDQVLFISGHCCTTVNIFDFAYAVRDGKVEKIMEVKGRGKSV
ncbi:MAG: DSD1 family PLP-dependent enzyme [Clostridia bacterium]|nr:DSD1 family PLP-dependent enzyme [Clostridia bacterium]